LRFNSLQIREQIDSYCLGKIQETIKHLDGLSDEGLVPRVFYTLTGKTVQQLSLFETADGDYETGEVPPIEID